eukprot:m.478499 g.478499  ORF g.478499 m.478499 type:complete len:210 (+) comp21153_c0_seq1:1904-2533(+)
MTFQQTGNTEEKDFGVLPAGGFTPGITGAPGFTNHGEFDFSKIAEVPGVGKTEYLFPEKAQKTRSWGERLCYGTGVMYITGNTLGGLYGIAEGLRHPEATNLRLKISTVLNAAGKRGPFLGNSLGVLALMYSGVNGLIVKQREEVDDIYNQAIAGAATGALFKSTRGVRSVGVASAVGLVAAVAINSAYSFLSGTSSQAQPQQQQRMSY